MSAVDRAFIKAYAKETPVAAGNAARTDQAAPQATERPAGNSVSSATRAVARASRPHAIEQMYHEGALYRVEQPAVSASRRVSVPAPHFQLPPRNSPRRTIRRSLLKLLDGESEPAAPLARQAGGKASGRRKVPDSATPVVDRKAIGRLTPPARQELAPETIFDPPPHDEPLPIEAAPAYQPVLPPLAPPSTPAPLNLAAELGPQIEVHGHWEAELTAGAGSLVILPEPVDLDAPEHSPRVELQLAAMPVPIDAPPQDVEIDVPAPTTTIDDVQLPQPALRVDPPHAASAPRPHAKFKPHQDESSSPSETEAYFGDAAEEAEPADSNSEAELNFADLDPAAAAATIAAATQDNTVVETEPAAAVALDHAPEPGPPAHCVPVWEVDRFQWPITVERLVSDKTGYFAQAGNRLVAAVRDGLRTLAVTGSRRGEGRTTLALCLARAAANAGIQIAVIDADFARPQLAARLGLEVSHGWQDAATGSIPLSEAAVRSLSDEITVLPLEAAAAGGELSLADPRVTATLRAAAATFELVIVDLGPLVPGEDDLFPEGEACPFDAAIVVRDLRYATAAESETIGERLYAAGVEAVGVAENFVVEEELPVTSV